MLLYKLSSDNKSVTRKSLGRQSAFEVNKIQAEICYSNLCPDFHSNLCELEIMFWDTSLSLKMTSIPRCVLKVHYQNSRKIGEILTGFSSLC